MAAASRQRSGSTCGSSRESAARRSTSALRERQWPLALVITAATLLWPCPARAEPYMALRDGFTCGDCHTNRTGGGMRNVTAEMHAGDILRLPRGGKGVLPAHEQWFSPNINEYFSVGADFRMVETLLFQDDPDTGGRVDNNTAFRSLQSNDFDLAQGTLYAQLRLIPDSFSLYIDERVAPGSASNNEGFGLLENALPWKIYVKAGRFFPGWGLKLEDDGAFVASTSGLNFNRTLSGIEIGRSALGWNWNASISEGGDKFHMLVLGSGSYVWGKTGPLGGSMIGASIAYSEPDDLRSLSYAIYGGFSIANLTMLAQGSLLDSQSDASDTLGNPYVDDNSAWVAYVEADYLLLGWLNAKAAFDWHDPDDSGGEDAQNRVSLGLEAFLDRFLQVRTFYRVHNGPEDMLAANRDTLTLEAHLLF